jgi:isoleucyl-tRNA synthetase
VYYLPATGVELDLHRPYIDQVQLEIGGERYVRIPEVLDCWMESGAMPYGQMHYPFENKEKMEASFPADYIVEYTGQIRARFYVMHVLGVILFDKPAYKNVVCHGVVAGNDGRKMSKSLGNFPDPKLTFEQYGGDAVRMSILTSPLFNAGDTSITEQSIAEALRGSILPLWNAFSFFVTYARIDGWTPSDDVTVSDNVLDQWIVGELQLLIQQLSTDLDAYDLQSSSRALGVFLDQLTNWYIRRSRRRFRKSESDTDKDQAYATLYRVLVDFTKVAAPFAPFICEYIYRELKKGTEGTKVAEGEQGEQGEQGANDISVHLTDWLEADEGLIDTDLSESMALTQRVVRMGLAWRSQHDIRVRQPLAALTIGQELDSYYMDIIAEELNIKSVQVDMDVNDRVTQICKPDGKVV